jgi:hypothetical protein
MADVNTRPHRATRQPPVLLLAQEHEHLFHTRRSGLGLQSTDRQGGEFRPFNAPVHR